MTQQNRPRFKTVQDWQNFIVANPQITGQQLYDLRKECYKEIEALRKRSLLVYTTQFIIAPKGAPVSIDLSDIDGFTDLISTVSNSEGVDVLLHSPGGSPDATERIVGLLRSKFKEVNFLIPHSAYSAATMLALSGNEIILHQSATLGPIDPQINGIPARSIKRGFAKVRDLLKEQGPESLPAYVPLIEKYSLELLEICEDAEKLSTELVENWLLTYMFNGEEDKSESIAKAVAFFSDYDTHKTHSRPILFDKIKSYNLKISIAENPLDSLIREIYILLNGFLEVFNFVKLYENNSGITWGRQFQQITFPAPPANP